MYEQGWNKTTVVIYESVRRKNMKLLATHPSQHNVPYIYIQWYSTPDEMFRLKIGFHCSFLTDKPERETLIINTIF